jgi:hypothetical protein
VWALQVEFRRVRSDQPGDVSGKFDRGDLHPEAEPKIRQPILPRELRRANLSLNTTFAEAAGTRTPET